MSVGRGRRILLGVAVLSVSMLAFGASKAKSQAVPQAKRTTPSVENLRIPLLFEVNSGQADPSVSYLARARGYTFLAKSSGPEIDLGAGHTRLSLDFLGAAGFRLQPEHPSQTRINDYHGRSGWTTNIATYERVAYSHLYPGIDLRFYGNDRQLEHDFIVAAKSNPDQIAFKIAGAISQRIAANGDLILKLRDGELRLKSPAAYQETQGKREAVSSQFQLAADGTIRFKLGRYDRNRALVIDPILSFSTYLGGSGSDSLRGVAILPSLAAPGAIYVAGVTNSAGLPATVGQTSLKGIVNGYIAKFNISTNALTWLTYFGGSGSDYINGMTIDTSGNVYLGGDTTSSDLPLAGNSVSTALNGKQDGFVAEISAAGSLLYSTYLGGSGADRVLAIAVDSSGFIDVTGLTYSSDFPTKSPIQPFKGDGTTSDLFVTRISTSTTTLSFSTTYGGTGNDAGRAIATSSIDIFVGGETTSTDFPTVNGMTPVFGAVSAYVVQVDPVKGAVVFDDVFGGSSTTGVTGVAVDSTGVYMTGYTSSKDFPIDASGNFQGTLAGGYDAFVTKLNPTGTGYLYSSYLGGSGNDVYDGSNFQGGISVVSNVAYVTGYTESTNFPLSNPTQGFLQETRNAFVTEVNSSATELLFSTFLGGSTGQSQGWGVAVNPSTSSIYVVGDTTDTDFPTVASDQNTNAGGTDGFLSVYQQPSTSTDLGLTVTPSTSTPTTGTSFLYTISVIDDGTNAAGDHNLTLYDTLPANVFVNSVFPFQGTCTTPTNQRFICNLGTTTPGTIITISVSVTPIAPTTLTNVAIVRGDDTDPNPTNNNVTTTITATYGSCLDPSMGNKGWMGGSTSGSPTDFNNANNWEPVGVPIYTDNVVICGNAPSQPVMSADSMVNSIVVESGATLDLGTHNLTANGNVQATGTISDGTLITTANPGNIQGNVPNLNPVGTTQLNGALSATGNVNVTGSLNLSGFTAAVAGEFQTSGTGVLFMRNSADHLIAGGGVMFNGGSEGGNLTDGILEVAGGDFVAGSQGSFDFIGEQNHTLLFSGSQTQNLSLMLAGSNQQLQNLTVSKPGGTLNFATNVPIAGNVIINSGTITGSVTAYLGGNLTDLVGNRWQVANTSLPGTIPLVSLPANGMQTALSADGAVALANSFIVTGSLTVTNNLYLNGQTATVIGPFSTTGVGNLTMLTAGDQLLVTGNATFNGGAETGLLTQGLIEVQGNFSASGGANAFRPTANNTLEFTGATNQMVSFALPGANQWINSLVVAKPTGSLTFSTNAQINGNVTLAAGTVTGPVTVTLAGSLLDEGTNDWQVANTNIVGSTPTLSSLETTLIFSSATVLQNPLTVVGSVVVSGALDLGSNILNVSGTFTTQGTGILSMNSGVCELAVAGNALFSGGSETGFLNAGALDIGGNFTAGGGASDSFHAVSPHLTRFSGSAIATMSNPGSGQQFGDVVLLGNLILDTPLFAQGTLYTNTGTTPSLNGPYLFSVGGVSVNGLTLNQTPLSIGNGALTEFDNVTFNNMDPTVAQLTIQHDGLASTFTINSPQFLTTPTTGKYISLTNTNPSAGQLVIDMASSTPANGSAFTAVDANSSVNWGLSAGTDVSVNVTANPLSAFAGQTINYLVNVSNIGTQDAAGVTVTISYTPFNGNINVTGASCTPASSIVCTIGTLPSTHSVPINVAITSDDSKVITVSATATLTGTDVNTANNTGNASATFNPIASPPFGTVNGTILYSRADTGNGTIWQAAGDGSSDSELIAGNWPRISPNLSYIVFHSGNVTVDLGNMYLYDVGAGTSSLIFSNNDYQNGYTFSPDSTQIYFDYQCLIDRVNLDGSGLVTVLNSDCYDDDPRFNPAGTQLTFENAHYGIGLFNPDGSGRAFIPNTQPGDYMPVWSPDGSRIAFVRFVTNGANNLFVINPDGTNLTRLSFFTVAGDGPPYGSIAWTPDGTAIVFAGAVNGVPGLYAIGTDGSGTLSQLTISEGNPPNWVGNVTGAGSSNSADVSLSAVSPATATQGNTLPLSLTITNNGPAAADGIQLVVNLPSGTSFLSGNSNQSQSYLVSCSAAGTLVTCTLPSSLPPSQSVQVLLDLAVQATGPLSFSANVSSTTPDSNTDNNSASATTQVGAPACVQPPSGIVSWYRAEYNAIDYTGAHDGTLDNSPQFVSGKVGQAFSLDGSSSYVDLANISGPWTIGSQWSVEAWVSPSQADLNRHAVVAGINNCLDWGIVFQNGQFGAIAPPSNGDCTATAFSNYPGDLNQYSHVVATNDGTTAKIYVNGQLLNSMTVSPDYVGFNYPEIGADVCCGEFFPGSVDEATIYNRPLSDTEISALFNAGSAGKCAAPSGSSSDIALSAASAPTTVNGYPTYDVTVTNNGPSSATDVVVSDTLNNYVFVSASTSQGNCSFNGQVSCGIGSLAVGASATIAVSVTAPNQGWASHEFAASADEPDPNPTNNLAYVGPSDGSFNTAVGSNISVQANDGTGDAVQVSFASVTRKGTTTLQAMTAAAPPAGYRFGTPPAMFDVSTTATVTGTVQLSFSFNPAAFHHPSKVRLFHMENGVWADRTVGIDLTGKHVNGATTSLSPFMIVEPLDNPPVANAGGNQTSPGSTLNGSSVMLNGSGSSDPDGDTLTYTWTGPFPEGGGTVTGVSPTVTLPFGASTVSLIVNDGEVNSPASVANITVTDFKLDATAVNDAVATGKPASFTIAVTPQMGSFNAAINLSCSGLPAGLGCSFASASVTPGATASSVTLTISRTTSGSLRSGSPYLALWLSFPFGVVLLGRGNSRRRRPLLLLIALGLIAAMFACGGGGSSGFSQQAPPSSSNVTVTVTGTSGTLSHSTAATVTINP